LHGRELAGDGVNADASSKLEHRIARFSVQDNPKPESLAGDKASRMELLNRVLLNLLDWQFVNVDWCLRIEARFDSSLKTGHWLTRKTCALFSDGTE